MFRLTCLIENDKLAEVKIALADIGVHNVEDHPVTIDDKSGAIIEYGKAARPGNGVAKHANGDSTKRRRRTRTPMRDYLPKVAKDVQKMTQVRNRDVVLLIDKYGGTPSSSNAHVCIQKLRNLKILGKRLGGDTWKSYYNVLSSTEAKAAA